MIRPEQRWHGAETMTCSTQRHNLYKPSNSPCPWLGPRLAQWPPKWTHYSPLLSSYTITVTCPELLFLYYLFPGGASRKGCACQCRRHRRRKRGNPLRYSCLKNSMGRGSWWATVHGGAKSRTGPNLHTHYLFVDKKLLGGKPATYLHPLQCFECDRWHLF